MATTTTRLALRKPAGTDLVTVGTDINNNMDILDNAATVNAINQFLARQQVYPQTDPGMSVGALSLFRFATTHSQSLSFANGIAYSYHIGRIASSDSLVFGADGGAGFVTDITFIPGGAIQTRASTSFFGGGVYGGAAAFTTIGDNGFNAALVAAGHGTAANANLQLRPKGTGIINFETSAGATIASFDSAAGGGTFTALIVNANGIGLARVQFGGAGTGPAGVGRALYI